MSLNTALTIIKNSIKTLANGHYTQSQQIGDTTHLTTQNKTSLVIAINELVGQINTLQTTPQGVSESQVNNIVQDKIAQLVGSAPAELDTLYEIATQMQQDQTAAAALLTKVGSLQTRIDAIETEFANIPDNFATEIQQIMTTGAAGA